jgi:hypothetical protein
VHQIGFAQCGLQLIKASRHCLLLPRVNCFRQGRLGGLPRRVRQYSATEKCEADSMVLPEIKPLEMATWLILSVKVTKAGQTC